MDAEEYPKGLGSLGAGLDLSFKVGADVVPGGEAAVPVGGVDGIRPGQPCLGLRKSLPLEDGIHKTVALMEGIEVKVFDETDSVDLELVDLGPELYRFDFLAPHDGTDVVLVEAHDTVLGLLTVMEVGVLLGMDLFGRRPSSVLALGPLYHMFPLQAVQLAAELLQ